MSLTDEGWATQVHDWDVELHTDVAASSDTRRRALAPESAAWWWLAYGEPSDRDARDRIVDRLRSGELCLVLRRRATASSTARGGEACELASVRAAAGPVSTSFIEISLVDERDQPLAHEEYELELPSGALRYGRLDASGTARIDGVPPGSCAVRFPRLQPQR